MLKSLMMLNLNLPQTQGKVHYAHCFKVFCMCVLNAAADSVVACLSLKDVRVFFVHTVYNCTVIHSLIDAIFNPLATWVSSGNESYLIGQIKFI